MDLIWPFLKKPIFTWSCQASFSPSLCRVQRPRSPWNLVQDSSHSFPAALVRSIIFSPSICHLSAGSCSRDPRTPTTTLRSPLIALISSGASLISWISSSRRRATWAAAVTIPTTLAPMDRGSDMVYCNGRNLYRAKRLPYPRETEGGRIR